MTEDTIRPAATRWDPIMWRAILALLAIGGVVLLSSGPVGATTTFTVNSNGDAGDIEITDDECDSDSAAGEQCTLRAAIEEANDTAGTDTIDFDIGSAAAQNIVPTSPLPAITDTVTIDGYTQTGASPNTLDQGNDAILNIQLDGLNAGTGAIGLRIEAADCTIKGLVIKRWNGDGVQITGAGASGNRIEGNFIGVNRDGITDRGNGGGVLILEAADNMVGGTQPDLRNVISGNDGDGVTINGFGGAATGNRVEGNYVGTDADGTADLGNAEDGVTVFEAANNRVGGLLAGAGNVISGNDNDGVGIYGAGSTENEVKRNYIGTSASGTADLGNAEEGVAIQSGASYTEIGSTAGGAGNRIAHNGTDGVSIVGSDSVGNEILSSSIYKNGGLGIDLVGGTEDASDVTANDTNDPDTGPNNLQNFPTISSATRSVATGETTISGRLNSNPSEDFVIQCFLTTIGAPASAYGEGWRLLDTTTASTNASGNARFSCVSSLPIIGQIPGRTVTATATNKDTGDTSEFSRNKTVTQGP